MTTEPRYHPSLVDKERFFAECQPFLLQKGYQLRSRYRANWTPARRGWSFTFWPRNDEEEIINYKGYVLDAVRLFDNQKVVLKRVESTSLELKIHQHLNSDALRADPRNHTIVLLDVIPLPETPWSLLVVPYCREFDYPPFHCRREFIDAMVQLLEGLQFMHDHNIVHTDIAPQNLLMEERAVVPMGSHFSQPRTHDGEDGLFCWKDRCSVGPVQYYYIDFGLAEHYPEGSNTARTTGILRTFPDIPELSFTVPYNPFKVDVFQLGLTMDKLITAYPDLEIFRPVSDAMMAQNPAQRPAPSESIDCLRLIASTFSAEQLGMQMWDRAATDAHKKDRAKLGGYRFDYGYLRDRALYGKCALDSMPRLWKPGYKPSAETGV